MKTATMAFIMIVFGFFGAAFAQDLTLLGSYDLVWPATEVAVEGNYAYLPDADSGLIVLDVSDPENPFLVGQGPPETRVEHISLFGNYIYGAREFYHFPPDSTHFKIIDVTDPASPVLVSTLTVTGQILDLQAEDEYVYSLNAYGNRLNVIDVSGPYNPVQAHSFHVTGLLGRLQIIGNTAYIITLTGHGLRIIDISNPLDPVEIGHSSTPGMSYDLFVHGDYAYIADISDLTIIDISNPASPLVLQDTFQVYTRGGITANGEYVIMGAELNPPGGDYLIAIDVENPADPRIASRYSMPETVHMGKPVVRNNCIYLPQYNDPNRLLIFDASITGIDESQNMPQFIGTLRSYPNPFNAKTVISFSIPEEMNVRVEVFNILGQKVAKLADGNKPAGEHSIIFNAENLDSGIYFYRLMTENYTQSNKMVLLK